jgi:dihydroorotate dehydrogenase (NAD+) catalytic subunit
MITLSNGHKILFANGSGALAFDGRGWWWEQPLRWFGMLDPKAFTVVAKTVTFEPRKGNLSMWSPWTCVRLVKLRGMQGATNAIGLTNNGYLHWIKHDYPIAKKMGYKIAVSAMPETVDEAEQMGSGFLNLKLAYIEVNLSCPNVHEVPEDIPLMLQAIGESSGHPIVLKLSYKQITEEFVSATDPYVEAYHAINTIPWNEIFPKAKSPIQKYNHKLQGGVSGQPIMTHAKFAVKRLGRLTDKPIIGGGGLFSLYDVLEIEKYGASAFSIGTLFLRRPWKPNQIVRQYLRRG